MAISRIHEFWPEWQITDILGKGAYGTVYRAVNSEAGFPVYSAIKVISIPADRSEYDALLSEGMTNSDVKNYFKNVAESFAEEIKLMASLKSAPNIVGVDTFKILEKTDGTGWDIYIRMELLISFKDYIQSKSVTEADVLKLGIDIATALEVCGAMNIIHRDIKPANIFITPFGDFKLGDFGIAKELDKTKSAISSKGTYSYMAPEVARGEKYDYSVDVYSLGIVMYSLLNNNRLPFVNAASDHVTFDDRQNAIDRRMYGEALTPPKNASKPLSDIILTACSFDPKYRFKTAAEFKNALLTYKNTGKATVAAPKPPKNTETKSTGKKRFPKLIAAILILMLLCAGAAGAFFFINSRNNDTDKETTLKETQKDTEKHDDTDAADTDKADTPPESAKTYSVGDIITLGSYEQDGDSSNGKEPIEWIVLETDGSKALVISKYGLDAMPYHDIKENVAWDISSIRYWLNSDFYNTAFDDEDKHLITRKMITNNRSSLADSVSDILYLLNNTEVNTLMTSKDLLYCQPTPYAKQKGVWVNKENGNCYWLLRPEAILPDTVDNVSSLGETDIGTISVTKKDGAVRPAMTIDLTKLK